MIELLTLRQLLAKEMSDAEARTRQSIRLNLPNAKEDDVTALFVVEAGNGLREATENGRVAAAVRTDLEYGYAARGRSAPTQLWHLTDGLIARLHRHDLKGETRTGGDFGLLLIEPQFDLSWGHELGLQRGGLKRGLLVQAKRQFRNGRWNQLTQTQVKRLPGRMAYTALLRYEFIDPRRRTMTDFLWHPLSDYSLSTVNEWLRTGVFPDGFSTPAVVAGLSKGEFGTKDQDIIEREICPESGSYVVIEVDWPDDQDPTSWVTLINREIQRTHHERQNIQIIRS